MPHTDWKARLGFTNVDILKEYEIPEVIKKYYPGGYLGFDKSGCPVFIDPVGMIDFKGLLHSVKGDDILRTRMFIAERGLQLCKQQTGKLENDISQITLIFDLHNLGLKHMWKPGVRLFNLIATLFEDNYPHLMKQTFIVNSPRVFPVLFALVKPFLSDETKRKIKVLGGNWKSELLKYIDANQLPVHYGGTLFGKDGDTMCKEQICYGGEVPASYYSHDENAESDGLDFELVKHGCEFNLEYKVTEPGSILHWYFRTEGHDIGFGVYRKEDGKSNGRMDEIIAVDKRESHLVAEDGCYTCNKQGVYIVKFDNSYSWTKSKKLHYQIGLTPATGGL